MLKKSPFFAVLPWNRDTTVPVPSTAGIFGLSLWLIALLLVVIKVTLEPGTHTVVDSYLLGADRWVDRVKLYSGPGGFIYSPTFAVLFVPFTKIPHALTDLLWRLLIIGFYFWSCLRLLKHFHHYGERGLWQWFGIFSLIAVPIAFSGFRNGQMNVVLIASMLMVASLIIEKRWNTAALLLALVMSMKPTYIVFFLLAGSLFKPLWWRLPLMLSGFFMIPVLAGGLEYGIEQYKNYIIMMDSAADLGTSTPKWASFFNILPQLGNIYIDEIWQTIAKIFLAMGTWFLCFYGLVRYGTKNGLIYMLSFAACYHVLFNPRSVNTDYIILGTITALWFTMALHLWKDRSLAIVAGVLSVGVLFAYDLSRLLAPGTTSWFNPLMATLFTGVLIWQLRRGRVCAP